MAGNIIDQWFAAASVEQNYNTMHIWDGDGNASRVFEINFQGGYINRTDVKAFMVNKTTQERTDLTVSFTGTNTVTLSTAVPTTHSVTIYRDTNKTKPLATFVDGAIVNASNLDRNAKQAVFAVAEMVDRFDSVTATAQDAIATAYQALSLSQTALESAKGAVDVAAESSELANAAVSTANGASQAANAAVQTANSAKGTAEGIDAKATQAMEESAEAVATANSAADTANGIDAKVNDAVSTANDAESKSSTALSTANGIDAKATEALDRAEAAVDTADAAVAQISAATVNLNKLWGTVKSINGNDVEWKGKLTVTTPGTADLDLATLGQVKSMWATNSGVSVAYVPINATQAMAFISSTQVVTTNSSGDATITYPAGISFLVSPFPVACSGDWGVHEGPLAIKNQNPTYFQIRARAPGGGIVAGTIRVNYMVMGVVARQV